MNVEDLEDESSIDPPPTKKSRFDYEAIIMGEMLSDIYINLAQSVLKVQFNKLNGFKSTLTFWYTIFINENYCVVRSLQSTVSIDSRYVQLPHV